MFTTFKQKLLLGVYIFVLLSIPVGTYLVSEYRTTTQSQAQESQHKTLPIVKPPSVKPTISPAKSLLETSELSIDDPLPLPSESPALSKNTTSYGPTLSFKVILEGRPEDNQATRLFVGIAEGTLTSNPKFLLNFSIDLPASGEYADLSLAGLDSGTSYTALLKGSAQIGKGVTFTMSPAVSNLNNGQAISLLSGDLNEDNVINSADYSIAKNALGATASSNKWNANADINNDGTINSFDVGFIIKNTGKTGDSGAWTSTPVASQSASLTGPPIGGPAGIDGSEGYWIWVPK